MSGILNPEIWKPENWGLADLVVVGMLGGRLLIVAFHALLWLFPIVAGLLFGRSSPPFISARVASLSPDSRGSDHGKVEQ